MKHKFFSLVGAACAALFSFTGLTSCGGGGDGQSTPGYMSYSDFAQCRKGFMIRGAQVWIKILPTSRLVTDGDKGNTTVNPATNTVTSYCTLRNSDGVVAREVAVDYTITSWVDFDKGIPATADLKFSMGTAKDVLNKDFLAAMGWTSDAGSDFTLRGDLNFSIVYTGSGGGEIWYSVTLNEDPISFRGYFSVIPNEM